ISYCTMTRDTRVTCLSGYTWCDTRGRRPSRIRRDKTGVGADVDGARLCYRSGGGGVLLGGLGLLRSGLRHTAARARTPYAPVPHNESGAATRGSHGLAGRSRSSALSPSARNSLSTL